MIHRGVLFMVVVVLALGLSAKAEDKPIKHSPDEVLVVYNSNSPISRSIASDYARKRNITSMLLVRTEDSAVDSDNETISFDDYKKLIERPVHDYLAGHDGINFIMLTKGVPLRISGAETGSHSTDEPSDAPLKTSVDSHLAAMDYKDIPDAVKIKITGSGATGCGWLNRYWNAKEPFSHAKFGGYLVTRLDGYTEADAKALVTRALEAEQGLTEGKILFDVQPEFGLGDKARSPAPITDKVILKESDWNVYNADMEHAQDLLDASKIPNEIDLTSTFVGHRNGLLGYFSWGSNDSHFSDEVYESLKFAPGSISDTAVSTCGRTFLPTKDGQSLLVDLIAHGLTCGKGYMDEPLLQANASPTILLGHYTSGYTMAESFYMASHFVGWQDVIIGDPLCCPYPAKTVSPSTP